MYYYDHYVIDWEKVKTLDDIKRLLSAMQIAFEPNNPHLKNVKDLVYSEPKTGYAHAL